MGRNRRWSLHQALQEGSSALIIVDQERRIRMVSAGLQKLTGWTEDDLLNKTCERAAPGTGGTAEVMACSVAPSAAVWRGASEQQDVVIPSRNGNAIPVRLTFVPLPDDESRVIQVLIAFEKLAATGSSNTGRSVSQQLYAEIHALRLDLRRRFQIDSYIGRCEGIRKALRQAEFLAKTPVNFLITGLEGTGRRHLARVIHKSSGGAEGSIAVLNCHLLNSELLISTLHQLKSLMTSGSALPHQKTSMLLLTEVDRLPAEVQNWLLRNHSLTDGGLWIGATSTVEAASLISGSVLMPELASALTTVHIHLPTLHSRGDDVLLLSQQFIDECRRDRRSPAEGLSEEVCQHFLRYRWPGQVRELRNTIDSACRSAASDRLQLGDLPMGFRVGQEAQRQSAATSVEPYSLEERLQKIEVELIEGMLAGCKGNKTEAARRLGLTRPKLYRRMKLLGLATDEGETE